MKFKYSVGDKVYFFKDVNSGVIDSIKIHLGDIYYTVNVKGRSIKQHYTMDDLENNTYSEKEWEERMCKESWKFKVGDVIEDSTNGAMYKVISTTKYRKTYLLEGCSFNATWEATKGFVEDYFVNTFKIEYMFGKEVAVFDIEQRNKKQYIPEYNEKYFYVDICDENLYGISTWLRDETDMHMLKLGLIKQTPQECVKMAKEILKKLDLEV